MKYPTVSSLCEGIAESIRRKEGSTELINPQDFAERIEALQIGSGESASTIEYLDMTNVSAMILYHIAMFSLENKVTTLDGEVYIAPTFTIQSILGGTLDKLIAVSIDLNMPISISMGGDAYTGTISGMLSICGINDLSAIPRLTKEQFYSLE